MIILLSNQNRYLGLMDNTRRPHFHVSLLLACVCCNIAVWAQPIVQLPREVHIVVNEVSFMPSDSWVDSLIDQAHNLDIKYEIVNTIHSGIHVTTKIRMPQVLTFPAVMHQIVIYYALLSDKPARVREKLLIYPYFYPLQNKPVVICSYSEAGIYEITDLNWKTIPVPPAPGPEEKYIYNQIIEKTLENLDIINDIPDVVLEQVAAENKRSVSEIKTIYQNIQLWQMAK